MQKESVHWFIPVVLVAGAGVAIWYYWSQLRSMPAAPEPDPQPVEQVAEPAIREPQHPVPEPAQPAQEAVVAEPLPALAESDAVFSPEISNLLGDRFAELLVSSDIIEKLVATIDNLPRSHVAERIRPVGRLDSVFEVNGQSDNDNLALSEENYARYDEFVETILASDKEKLVALYRRYYPLFQEAYINLGYPDGYFNDRLVEVIDHLLETPSIREPIALVQPNVLYEFRDASLESLSSGQKLIIRMGQANAAKMKESLSELRALVVDL